MRYACAAARNIWEVLLYPGDGASGRNAIRLRLCRSMRRRGRRTRRTEP